MVSKNDTRWYEFFLPKIKESCQEEKVIVGVTFLPAQDAGRFPERLQGIPLRRGRADSQGRVNRWRVQAGAP
jgi:hypothetical protein